MGCGREAPSNVSPDFGYLCIKGFQSGIDEGYYEEGDVLVGGYAHQSLGTKCGDPWGHDPFWQLLCTDCLRKAGYLW